MPDDKLEESQREYYAKRAPIYDAIYNRDRSPGDTGLAGLIRRHFGGLSVLEVACGTAYWTEITAEVAASVLATDVNDPVLQEAKEKPWPRKNVRFQIADAFSLEGVGGSFNAGLAVQWWSHIPKARRAAFLAAFCSKLEPGSIVVLSDSLYKGDLAAKGLHYNDDGDLIHTRKLPSGESFEVIKNLPTEDELRNDIDRFGERIGYYEFNEKLWAVDFTTRSLAKTSE